MKILKTSIDSVDEKLLAKPLMSYLREVLSYTLPTRSMGWELTYSTNPPSGECLR